jgi:hypothetical protein
MPRDLRSLDHLELPGSEAAGQVYRATSGDDQGQAVLARGGRGYDPAALLSTLAPRRR